MEQNTIVLLLKKSAGSSFEKAIGRTEGRYETESLNKHIDGEWYGDVPIGYFKYMAGIKYVITYKLHSWGGDYYLDGDFIKQPPVLDDELFEI